MKKTIIVVALGLLSLNVQAGAYSDEVARKDLCSNVGLLGKISYLGRITGDPREKYIKMSSPLSDRIADQYKAERMRQITRYAIDYGYDQASSGVDAHMKGWANCMDKS